MSPLERFAKRIAPADRLEWITAMLAEAQAGPRSMRIRWQAAALIWALRLRVVQSGSALLPAAFASTMIIVDWRWGSLAPALLLALAAAALLLATSGRGAAFAVSAGALPVAHAVANWMPALWPPYQFQPLTGRDWIILALFAAGGVCTVRIAEIVRGMIDESYG